jgi:hypothetical protein
LYLVANWHKFATKEKIMNDEMKKKMDEMEQALLDSAVKFQS